MLQNIFFYLIFSNFVFQTNTEDIWKTLMSVKYTFAKEVYIPTFDEKQKALDGKTVTIKGYMYPLTEAPKHQFFMLSYYPTNVCFFCGGAGPETIVEVNAKSVIKFSHRAIELKGTLKLNHKDRDRLFYILMNAEQVEE